MDTTLTFPARPQNAQQTFKANSLRIGSLCIIILLHAGLFYMLNSNLLRQAVPAQAAPKEVIANLIAPRQEPTPEPPKPQVAQPKTVPVMKKQVPRPKPTPKPAVKEPAPHAITTPSPAPTPAEPVVAEPASVPAAPPVAAAPAVPAVPAVPAQPRTITSGIEYIQPPNPQYPPISKRMGEEGKAILRVLVNEKGRPETVDVQRSSGSPRLDEAARQAALKAVFRPFVENGKAVAAFAIIPIRFQLDS